MIEQITLTDFRNFKKKAFSFSPQITVIIGSNAAGKTNILESIYLLSTGKSFRAKVEEEMINYEKEIARIKGKIIKDEEVKNIEIALTRGQISLSATRIEKVARKRLLIDGSGKRLIDFAGQLKAVLFSPADLDLVTQSPSTRRRFLDFVISQVDREYRRSILSYEKGLRQRNRLLLRIREQAVSRSYLHFWDRLLIKNGDYIGRARQNFIDFVNSTPDFDGQDFILEYDKSAISESRLNEYKEEEVAAATTLVGPHRDDFCIKLKKNAVSRELARFGSRGEARMGVLWLKLAELGFIEKQTGEKPTLLLDDIFSELDSEHEEIVINLAHAQQTIITTTAQEFSKEKNIETIFLN